MQNKSIKAIEVAKKNNQPMNKVAQFRFSLSLRISIGIAFVGIVILTSALLGAATYLGISSFIRRGISEELRGAVGLTALAIDPAVHATIQKPEDEKTEAYAATRRVMRKARNLCRNVRFIYTMRMSAEGQVVFVVDAEENPSTVSHIGAAYSNPSPKLLAAFSKPYEVQMEDCFQTDEWGTFLSSYAPITGRDGGLDAVLGMDISAHEIVGYERFHLAIIAGTSSAIALFVILLGFVFAALISHPLILLESDMARIREFDLSSDTRISSRITEVEKIKQAVDNMKTGLRSFRKYVPADLVADLIKLSKEAVLSTDRRNITIFFSDIENFTAISEQIPPEQLIEYLSLYFQGMTTAILNHRGTVDKYIGDSIMAFWGAPYRMDNHALSCCLTALQCQRFGCSLAKRQAAAGLPSFKTRIGINSGEAIVGNIGYEERMNYTTVGDAVNIASRMEGLNKHYGTSILITESTYEQAADRIKARMIDIVAVKGRCGALKIYELVSEKSEIDEATSRFMELFAQGMNLYLSRSWSEAKDVFREAVCMRPHDKPSLIFLDRCEQYIAAPPDREWNGIFIMAEK